MWSKPSRQPGTSHLSNKNIYFNIIYVITKLIYTFTRTYRRDALNERRGDGEEIPVVRTMALYGAPVWVEA